jgi:23S rRNA (pseudouridine1915-N3)-methyltransferase
VRIILAATGRMKAGPERELCDRYVDRAVAAGRQVGFTGVEIREFPESQARQGADRMAEEARAMVSAVPAGAILVLLDERGRAEGSRAFAERIGKARDAAAPAFVLAIGGADGHGPAMRDRADVVLAFGTMTWPHQLARIMAAEQIYRAVTILTGHPYHRE